jgi:hypothetical protein
LQNVKGVYRPVNWFWSFSGKNFLAVPIPGGERGQVGALTAVEDL